jgi:chromosome segregation ATPase
MEKPVWLSLACAACAAVGAWSKPLFNWLKAKRRSTTQNQVRATQLDYDAKTRESMMRETMFKEIQLEIQYLRERCAKLEAMVELERSMKHSLANKLNPLALELTLAKKETEDGLLEIQKLGEKVKQLDETIRERDRNMRDLHDEIVKVRIERDDLKRELAECKRLSQ